MTPVHRVHDSGDKVSTLLTPSSLLLNGFIM